MDKCHRTPYRTGSPLDGSRWNRWCYWHFHYCKLLFLSSFSSLDSWSELCSSIFRYAAQIPVSHNSQPLIMSRLENLLERVRLKSHRRRTPGSKVTVSYRGDVDWSPCSIPWDDVLVICIDHKLKDWQVPGAPVCEGEGVIWKGYFNPTLLVKHFETTTVLYGRINIS